MTAGLCLSFLSACAGGNSANEPSPGGSSAAPQSSSVDTNASAELTIYSIVASITQDEFHKTIEAPIRAKYPNFKVNYLLSNAQNKLDNMVMTGNAPDIIITSIGGLYSSVMPFQLQYDITELVKKHKYDLSRIESSTIESLRNASGTGALYGLPKYTNSVVLFYNKDVFDKFGVAYPKNGMTWDDALKLATQMTRTVDGISYRGMALFSNNMLKENQLSLLPIDPSSDKASVNTPGYQKLFQTYKSFFDIVGNKPAGNFSGDNELNMFYKDKNIAMVIAPMSGYGRFEAAPDLNWDIVAAPTFPDKPGIGFQANTIYYYISNVNKKAEQAFLAVAELLSDKVQLEANKAGRPTVLVNESIRATLGDESASKGKNFKALFHNKFAPTPTPNTKLAPLVNTDGIVNKEFGNMINTGNDVNTTLRQLEEQINKAINEANSKQAISKRFLSPTP